MGVAGERQTEIYAPKEAEQAPHDHALVDRNKSEIQQGDQWPELQPRHSDWPEILPTVSRVRNSWIFRTYTFDVVQNALPILALECADYCNEEQCVHCRCQCLIQDELFGCVRFM